MKILDHLWRIAGLYLIPAAVLAWLWHTDPDQGQSTIDMLRTFSVALLAVTGAHLGRRFLMPYLRPDKLIPEIMKGNIAAAIALCASVALTIALVLLLAPRAIAGEVETFVPAGAQRYGPVLKAEQIRLWPAHPAPQFLGALVELESCVTLRSPRCWNPAARLKTDREEGAGLGQITRAYRKDGTVRMDALAEARRLDPSLGEWSWSNVYSRPDLQLRAIVAMNRDCDRRLRAMVVDPIERLRMCDAAYNGGYGGMQAERRACGQRAGCDPQRWFGQVERVCLKSTTPWQGYSRSACDINREHVHSVTVVRAPKYLPMMGRTT